MGWMKAGDAPAGMKVSEIQVEGQPAFLFRLDEAVKEGEEFSMRFTWGAMNPLGSTLLSWPAGMKAQIWIMPDQLVADREWIDQIREIGGDEWVSKVSHPHYLPEKGTLI